MEPTYTVVRRQEPEGGFRVLVQALPEVVSYGETMEETPQRTRRAPQGTLDRAAALSENGVRG